jgi:uncharacterized integral membrane protein
MPKRQSMAALSVLCLLSVWALGMPKGLLILAAVVTGVLVLNVIFRWVE